MYTTTWIGACAKRRVADQWGDGEHTTIVDAPPPKMTRWTHSGRWPGRRTNGTATFWYRRFADSPVEIRAPSGSESEISDHVTTRDRVGAVRDIAGDGGNIKIRMDTVRGYVQPCSKCARWV